MTDASLRPASAGGAPRVLPPLYPIIDVDLCGLRGLDPLTVARGCLDGGARLLQVRRKAMTGGTGTLLALIREIVAAARLFRADVIVNDRADLALLADAEGVHVGQYDLPAAAARRLIGAGRIVGVSTHTAAQVDEALAEPSDYIAVGPVFHTSTKDTGYNPRGIELVRQASGRGKPVVAIGGISLATAPEILAAGATSVAVISDLLEGGQIASRVQAYLRALS